jgi:hypothetical protein
MMSTTVLGAQGLEANELYKAPDILQPSYHRPAQFDGFNDLRNFRVSASTATMPPVSYVNIIPLVYCALTPQQTQDRTNIGINNFT